ncbi:hypothetical protein [Sinorhizobium sp. BJ1]|uniref:hypothetical protein n=1 Tax=Sinorhizobium sp. BJ1 TaxID=2035455 RepID=UPI000BEC861C|nr:hypothetical protein [Sinorhizobium sp. BJ1]PDT81069.1 hypothetical protein CO676_24400 [Sinorhizobium sp. BJ1]
MGTVITLRSHTPITVKASPRHRVRIRVSDRAFPESTRWDVQRPVQNAGGFQALDGFNDQCARSWRWHAFKVTHHFVSRFVRQIAPYILRGQVDVQIDGQALDFKAMKKLSA